MKDSFSAINRAFHADPVIAFEDQQQLTSYSGLVIIRWFLKAIDFKAQLSEAFRGQPKRIYPQWKVLLLLITHILLGFRRIRDQQYYANDPLVLQLLGLDRLPDPGTITRSLASCDQRSVSRLRSLCQRSVLRSLPPAKRITLDFDGTVISTKRRAEATAVGFNPSHKGQRSYYPCFCTEARSGQVFDVLPRSGNVHDSNQFELFLAQQCDAVMKYRPGTALETRMDSAFYSRAIIDALNSNDVDFTISVPFTRHPELKQKIQDRRRWRTADETTSYFEIQWKPKSWDRKSRFILIRRQTRRQQKEAIQLDLFEPIDYGYEYKAIVTNKEDAAPQIIAYHEGRGQQESVLGELKSDAMLDYVPFKRLISNNLFMLSAIFAHNLNRQFQIDQHQGAFRKTNDKRTPMLAFLQLKTIRNRIIARAGRFTRPQNVMTLTIAVGKNARKAFMSMCARWKNAA